MLIEFPKRAAVSADKSFHREQTWSRFRNYAIRISRSRCLYAARWRKVSSFSGIEKATALLSSRGGANAAGASWKPQRLFEPIRPAAEQPPNRLQKGRFARTKDSDVLSVWNEASANVTLKMCTNDVLSYCQVFYGMKLIT